MADFKSGPGIVSIINSVGLIGFGVYAYRRMNALEQALHAMEQQINNQGQYLNMLAEKTVVQRVEMLEKQGKKMRKQMEKPQGRSVRFAGSETESDADRSDVDSDDLEEELEGTKKKVKRHGRK